jgi:hypothetical protein
MESHETKSCPVVPSDTSTLKWVGMGATKTARVTEPTVEPRLAEMTVCPVAALMANPDAVIVATAGEEELQSTLPVTSFIKPLA